MKPLAILRKTLLLVAAQQMLWMATSAGAASGGDQGLLTIHEEAKEEFFSTIDKFIKNHPLRSEVSGDDMLRILDASNEIPDLFERLMIIAYQKHEPTYKTWIEKDDAESMEKLREHYVALASEYGQRFVGSLFRRSAVFDFEMSLDHNRGKGRLDLVLQSIGYNARNDLPDYPREQWYTNSIEPDFTTQWALDAVNARNAQELSEGSGVIVAVIDSGLDPYNSLFQDKVVPGFSFLKRTTPPWEREEASTIDWGVHGTATASSVLMIAPDARIMPVRVLDADTMNDPAYDYWLMELMAAGVYYAVNHGAHVIQIGAALRSSEPIVAEAVRYAYHKNVVISTSAGNIPRVHFGLRPEEATYRSFENEVLLVGGVEKNDMGIRPWLHTVPGPTMDVATPSKDVFVVVPVYLKELKNDYVAGTSLSSPIASGVVALMRSAAPPTAELLSQPGVYCRLVSQCLRETAHLDTLGLVEPNEVVGQGLVDAYAAVQKIRVELDSKK